MNGRFFMNAGASSIQRGGISGGDGGCEGSWRYFGVCQIRCVLLLSRFAVVQRRGSDRLVLDGFEWEDVL